MVEGLSEFMAEALRVVSAPDAFLQREQGHSSMALPCFSFNKRGALVKTMSRRHSMGSQETGQGVACIHSTSIFCACAWLRCVRDHALPLSYCKQRCCRLQQYRDT